MVKLAISFAGLLALIPLARAQAAAYGQCGGEGWTGATASTTTTSTTSSSSSTTTSSQSTTSTTSATSTTSKTATSTSSAPPASSSTNSAGCASPMTLFQHFGVNESGAEFGSSAIPGALGTDYTYPSPSSIDYFVDLGFNTFRLPFLMERMNPPATGLTGAFNETYLSGYQNIVEYITGKGAYAIIDPHNYMRYNGDIITSTSDFATWWGNLAAVFASNDHVIFDIQNEPYGIDAGTVFDLMQAALTAIRGAGATTQLITVEGTSYTGAWTWTTSGNSEYFAGFTDPNDNWAVQMHQYLDSDGSGTSATCVNNTIGANRLADATAWLQANNVRGYLGEIGAGSNSVCIEAIQGALCQMQQSGVWIGAGWWAAGPWWGDYFQSIEPPSGSAIASILPQALEPFLPVATAA
ncbi:hypothetical protein H0H92_011380 [Tricholoma furcatifolium]|nr:hypothetical protein H0H92_011380 [Tricholoma furcatifolium]